MARASREKPIHCVGKSKDQLKGEVEKKLGLDSGLHTVLGLESGVCKALTTFFRIKSKERKKATGTIFSIPHPLAKLCVYIV